MSGERNIFGSYTQNKVFIETGSYYGEGIQRALDVGFERIISIEITPKYFNLCQDKFKNNTNVEILFGDSVKILPGLLESIDEPVTLWLDAHYTEPSTLFNENGWCPILNELEIIKAHAQKYNDILLIDDLRVWEESCYAFDCDDIRNKLKEINSNVAITYDDGFVPNDVLVAKFENKSESKSVNIELQQPMNVGMVEVTACTPSIKAEKSPKKYASKSEEKRIKSQIEKKKNKVQI